MKEVIYGVIPSKSNSYTVGSIHGHYCLVKSYEVKRYEREFEKQCKIYKGRMISTPFHFKIDAYYPDYRHDLDGCFKVALDCLQSVGAIANDNLCVSIEAKRHCDTMKPRIEFEIIEINEQKKIF